MKHILIALFLSCLFAACDTSTSSEVSRINEDSVLETNKHETVIPADIKNKRTKSEVDFLSVCDSLEIWKGGIQGVPKSDSTGVYIMAQCASNVHFDLIIYSEREVSLEEASDSPHEFIKAGIKDAAYYAFEVPKRKSISLEEAFDTYDYFFPCDVKIYKRFSDGWYLIGSRQIKSFEELGRLKLNTIFNK